MPPYSHPLGLNRAPAAVLAHCHGWFTTFALVGGLFSLCSQRAFATAIGLSDLQVESLTVTPATGVFTLIDPWKAAGFAQAQNSLGALDSHSVNSVGGMASTSANVTWADAVANVDASSGAAQVNAHAQLVGIVNASSAANGLGTLTTTFMISGSGSGRVDVLFGIDLVTQLSVFTDSLGLLAEAEAILSLEVGGQTVLFHHDLLSIGPSNQAATGFDGPLSDSISLELNTPYTLVLQQDAEARVVTAPERSGMVPSIALGFLVVVGGWHRRRHARYPSIPERLGGVP